MPLKDKIKSTIVVVSHYAHEETDWFKIKRLLINSLPSEERVNFSTRHPKTKKHIINDFDNSVIKYWEELTGNTIYINSEKLHRDTNG
jgi:hypothetical protein